MSARVYEFPVTLPTYTSELSSRLAQLFEGGKVPLYPYTCFVETHAKSTPRTYKMLALENRHLRVLVAPELGGRVWSIRDKRLKAPLCREGIGAELLFDNRTVKPYRVEPRNSWISAGIEYNFPVAHSHTSVEPVGSRTFEANGRAYVEVGEVERRLGLSWVVRLSLGEDDAFLTQETFLSNPGSRSAPWHFWSNCAIDGFDDTEFIYPAASIVTHGTYDDLTKWPCNLSFLKNREGMLGLFWVDHTDIYFGAFHHNLGYGVMHLADPKVVPGMKLWSFGKQGTREWAKLLGDEDRGYAEIQSGAFKTQDEVGLLKPGESKYFIEFWMGARSPEEIRHAVLPKPVLSAPPPQPLGMAHIPECQRWLTVLEAHRKNAPAALPDYDPADLDWPPTGLELEAALRWAAQQSKNYRTALGTWLTARGEYAKAMEVLLGSEDPFGKRVLGLTAWHFERDFPKARAIFESLDFTEIGYRLDHDALLAHSGDQAAREKNLAALPTDDDRVVERIADRLVAVNRPKEAVELLLGRKWLRQHERFIRTDIWRRARAALGAAQDPVPNELCEDLVPPVSSKPTPHGPLDGVLRKSPDLPKA